MPVTCKSSKGFGDITESSGSQNPNEKVNERGKVSTRLGPVSPKVKEPASAINSEESSNAITSVPRTGPLHPSLNSSKPENSEASTPQVVVDRMFPRMVTCAALPVLTGLLLLVFFYFQKEAMGDDFPMWIVYVSQNLTFGGGLLGITYGIISTSWDPSREGSVLGWDEFRANLPVLLNQGKKR
ncbi:hypothetical protein CEUSTIGMA_g10133.t1 [Chlamydomonas eustigma]|uniref:Protein PAM68, chloroplastic n=1 Tax=Chlamydomonas eustigma TaxID=1157962 RepID=A0A250XHZ4_9CHLO|nr:hypothetical protein CEUSTIGMA_g10133.t1 [Chlamydomonas eustigma]|eukprot:GAX82707.1 hypothetical protein CEUSTIGMA_g10133.t1 [Chlamydomonas eustigma]